MVRTTFVGICFSALLLTNGAWAQETSPSPAPSSPPPAPPPSGGAASASASASLSTDAPSSSGESKEKGGGAVLLGAKVGGLVAFSGLNPNVRAGLELGYVFPFANRSIAAVLDVSYAAPKTEGTQAGDPRVPNSTYAWHLTEQELVVMPTLVYRITSLGKIVPYAGIGPRIYLMQSNVKGDVNGTPIAETTEKSTKFGVGVPLGAQLALGPGALFGEVLLEYGPLDHTATGDSNTGAASLLLGYRLLL